MKQGSVLIFVGFVLISSMFCSKEQGTQSNVMVENSSVVSRENSFVPAVPVTVENGTLVFSTLADLNKYVSQCNQADNSKIDIWETQVGFKSQRRYVDEVIIEEDLIDTQVESLSETQQNVIKQQPEWHSTKFIEAQNAGLVKYFGNTTEGIQWDFGVCNIYLIPALNTTGLVKAEGKIYQYTSNGLVKLIRDGDFSKVSQLGSFNAPMKNQDFIVKNFEITSIIGVSEEEDPEAPDPCLNNNFSITNPFIVLPANSKRRVRVSLICTSKGTGNINPTSTCPVGEAFTHVDCGFFLVADAQRKNIWGTWKKKNDYKPRLDIASANWQFSVSFYRNQGACSGAFETLVNPIQITSPITLGGVGTAPLPQLSPFNHTNPSTNHAVIECNPHVLAPPYGPVEVYSSTGVFLGTRYYKCALNFDNFNFPVTYDGIGPTAWGLVK